MIYGMLYIWLAISVLTCQSSMRDVKPTSTVGDSDKFQGETLKPGIRNNRISNFLF